MKKIIKDNKYVVTSFILSLIILLIISLVQGLYPFGKNSLIEHDLMHQYAPFLNELVERIYNGKSLIYSFSISGGIPFFRTILNYLSSPLNILLLLFKNNIVSGITLLIYLKISLSSLTMSYYLKNTFRNDKSIILFSLLYAFSGYIAAYYFNIMWLDGMFLLPLILLGINKLIEKKKPYLYIFSLAIMLLSNYYIGYMICITSVLYFMIYLYLKGSKTKKEILKTFILFAFSSLIAGTLVFFALLPMYISIQDMSAINSSLPYKLFYINPLNFVFSHLQGNGITIKIKQTMAVANISCGILSIFMIILLFLNKKIKLKYKKVVLGTIIFFFLTFSFSYLDFVWNVFHLPNDLPWRYSFVYSFALIVVSYYSYTKLKYINKKEINKAIIIISIIPLLALITQYENLKIDKIIIIFLIITIYNIIFKYKINENKKFISLLLIVMFECIFNINTNWIFSLEYKNYNDSLQEYNDELSSIEDKDLYKLENYSIITQNIGSWTNTQTISGFSSTNYSSMSLFQGKIGVTSNEQTMHRIENINTPVYNSIFNIKYHIFYNNTIPNDEYFIKNKQIDKTTLYDYKYHTSLMYAVNKETKSLKLASEDPFINQNELVNKMTNNNIFKKLKVEKIKQEDNIHEYIITTNKEDTYIYIDSENTKIEALYNEKIYYIDGNLKSNIINIGVPKEKKIKIKVEDKNINSDLIAYTINKKEFSKFYKEISDELVTITENKEDYIKGNVKIKEDKIIFTTIPYDKAWQVYIDDKEVETYAIDNTLLAFDITEGEHNIVLRYKVRGGKLGITISLISLISLVIYSIIKRSK